MKKVLGILLLTSILFVSGCSTVPLTGRRQMALYPESSLVEMSLTNYGEFLGGNKLSTNAAQTQMVRTVGARIAKAVEKYLTDNGYTDMVSTFKWEFNLVEDNTPNAWAMPGGKVVVYTGILPYTKDADGLAVVMGHEVAHAVARHGNERMSQGMLVELGGIALSEAIKQKPETTQSIFLTAYGVGSQVAVTLPYSRKHESEADDLGLIFMAMAGYNPSVAVDFWTRMAQSGSGAPLEILSTHPSDAKRIENIKAQLPKAMQYYNAAK
ncbi:MAG: M48 family metallopeptidase [Prolixibacteraceae bacterium]|nr:M48 family metallopeptidase [Prolixibacteraceae bacterium]